MCWAMILDENEPSSGFSCPLFVTHATQFDDFRQTGAIT
jgi:hypothetical protein